VGRTVVGLDIGSSGVRAAEMDLSRRRPPSLRAFAAAPLPEGAVRAGVVIDPAAVAGALKKLWRQGRFSTNAVTFGIANEGVLVRQLDLDWMPPADFRKAIRYQVADTLPVPVEEANLDYHVLEELDLPGEQDGETRRVVRILLVAAAREVVDGFVEAIRAAGLRPVRADLRPFALIRLTNARLVPNAPSEAILDIGSDTVSVTVHSGGRPRFVRMLPGVGGAAITRALQDQYGWSQEDAERTKIELGLPDAGQLPGLPARELIAKQVTVLVSEVRATLDYFRSADADSGADPVQLSRVLLTGAGSRLLGLAERLADEFGVEVEPLSTLACARKRRRLRLDTDAVTALAAPAGLCMGVPALSRSPSKLSRSPSKQHFPIGLPVVNLLSPRVFEAIAARRLRRRFIAAGVGLVLLTGGGWGVQHLRSVQAEKLLTVERAETSRLTAQTQELAPVSVFVAEVAKQKTVVKKTMATEALLSRMLDDLRLATPTGVRIETIGVTIDAPRPGGQLATAGPGDLCPAPNPFVQKVSVGCVTLTGTATSREAVGRLVTRLGAGDVFVAPYVTTTSTADGARVTFSGSVALSKRIHSNRYADLEALLATGGAR
jgi:type IV pilus assembly protein PilM